MATFYVLRSKKDGRLYQQEFRGTYREVVPTATLEDIRYIHDLMIFHSYKEAEQFVAHPRPWRLDFPEEVEIAALDMNVRVIKRAIRQHVVTDQGNGGAYCSECGTDLTDIWTPGKLGGNAPNPCPGCGLEWVDGEVCGYSFGGSDF